MLTTLQATRLANRLANPETAHTAGLLCRALGLVYRDHSEPKDWEHAHTEAYVQFPDGSFVAGSH